MQKTAALCLLCLSLVLVVLPTTHRKPGMPPTFKADEPAYYLAALSLARDGDLRCQPEDLERLFQEYPYRPVNNLILSTDDGWHTVYYGKPYIYSFLAAPFAAVWGANGLVVFNALLLVAMIWMGALHLRRYNADWLAALFAAGFFLMSTTYAYVYWLQPELLNMFSTAACLFFGLRLFGPEEGSPPASRAVRRPRWLERPFAGRRALVWSAAALSLGVYNKPMLAAVGLPVCFLLLSRRRFADLAVWLASAALSVGLLAGVSTLFTGHPTAYLGVDRQGYNIHSPHHLPMEPEDPAGDEQLGRSTAGWWWIFGAPRITWGELREDLRYFFVGRHTGLFLYQPFSLVALGLFLAFGRRSAVRWAVLGAIVVIAAFFLLFIPHNWHGGGGFVGNRYFLTVYPAFLFLVTRIRPDWVVALGAAAGSLFVGPLLLSPLGLVVPSPSLQAHARNPPFQAFPLEHSLREIPGYWRITHAGVHFYGRKDHLRLAGRELWIAGGGRAELWLQSVGPITDLVFDLRSQVPDNEVELRIEDAREQLVAGPEPRRVMLSPTRPTLRRKDHVRGHRENMLDIYVYRMEIRAASGELPRWRDQGRPRFYLGCALTFLGTGEEAMLSARTPELADPVQDAD